MKLFFANWKTTVPGILVLLCGGTQYFDMLPANWANGAMAFCSLMVALGLIAAKDADRSNAPVPTVASVQVK